MKIQSGGPSRTKIGWVSSMAIREGTVGLEMKEFYSAVGHLVVIIMLPIHVSVRDKLNVLQWLRNNNQEVWILKPWLIQ